MCFEFLKFCIMVENVDVLKSEVDVLNIYREIVMFGMFKILGDFCIM